MYAQLRRLTRLEFDSTHRLLRHLGHVFHFQRQRYHIIYTRSSLVGLLGKALYHLQNLALVISSHCIAQAC